MLLYTERMNSFELFHDNFRGIEMQQKGLLEYLESAEWKGVLNASLLENLCRKQSQRKWNWKLPTQGGKVFWETLTVEDWKIQRNIIDRHCRILNPDNKRCAYGSEIEIKSLFENYLSEQRQRESSTRKKYGIVFAGGGGKGAFQIGVWKYLHEKGLDQLIDGVSGTSVGALNSLLFINGDLEIAEKIWGEIKQIDMTPPNFEIIKKIFQSLAIMSPDNILVSIIANAMPVPLSVPTVVASAIKTASKTLIPTTDQHSESNGISTQWRLEEIIDENICWDRVEQSNRVAYCTLSANALLHKPESFSGKPLIDILRAQGQKEYICWAHKNRDQIKNLVLASSSLPFLFGAREVNGHKCLDGGIQDNIPISPLVSLGFSEIIVVHLQQNKHETLQQSDFSREELELQGAHIYNVYPEDDSYDDPIATIRVGPEQCKMRMEQGYFAAKRQLTGLPW